MSDADKILDNLSGELKRGTLVICVLLSAHKPIYGYSLVQLLQDEGIKIDKNTLYPLLRRLEKQTLLKSSWDTGDSRPRKYYEISDLGKIVLEKLVEEWKELNSNLSKML